MLFHPKKNKKQLDILRIADSIAIEKKRKEIQQELTRVDSKIKKFEKKYKLSFDEYEKSMGDSFQHHNDWIDWSFLEESRKQLVELTNI